MIGYFDDERTAALAVDKYLDSVNDFRRPRNRDDFPELLLTEPIEQEEQ